MQRGIGSPPKRLGPLRVNDSVRRSSAGRTSATFKGLALVFSAALVLLAGCGNAGSGQTTRQTLNVNAEPAARAGQLPIPPGRTPTKGPIGLDPSKADGVQLDVLSGLLDDTPVFNGDFADPFALRTPDDLYIYASNTETTRYAAGAHVPVIALARNSGFKGQYLGDAMPSLPKWTVSGFQWAPSVWTRPDGTYVMYYSTPATIPLGCLAKAPPSGCVKTTNGPSSAMCISRATSASPAGPFTDDSSSAFVCPLSQGGAIDPSVFVAPDGTPWLLWKSDGDCCNMPTTIYSQQLSADGLSVVGPAHRLIGASQSWEGNLVEGPSMIENGNTYWLFYSANLWGTDNYGIGVASCATVVGPCTKPLDHAWLSSTASGGQGDPGPGGEEFFQVGGLIWMVHHGLAPGQSGNGAERRLYVDLLSFPGGQMPRLAPPRTGGRTGRSASLLRGPECADPTQRGISGALAQSPERLLARHGPGARRGRAARMQRSCPRAGRQQRRRFSHRPRTEPVRSRPGRDSRFRILLPPGRFAGPEGRTGGVDAELELARTRGSTGRKDQHREAARRVGCWSVQSEAAGAASDPDFSIAVAPRPAVRLCSTIGFHDFQGGSGETVSIRRQGLRVTFADALRDHVAQVQWMDSMSC